MGGVGQHLARDAVQSRNIDYRGHERDIATADIRRRVAAGHRGDQQLGNSDRQGPQGGSDQGGAAGAAQPENAEQPIRRKLLAKKFHQGSRS